jgi:hypothetical protein
MRQIGGEKHKIRMLPIFVDQLECVSTALVPRDPLPLKPDLWVAELDKVKLAGASAFALLKKLVMRPASAARREWREFVDYADAERHPRNLKNDLRSVCSFIWFSLRATRCLHQPDTEYGGPGS